MMESITHANFSELDWLLSCEAGAFELIGNISDRDLKLLGACLQTIWRFQSMINQSEGSRCKFSSRQLSPR